MSKGSRQYNFAFFVAKICEILSVLILVIGVFIGIMVGGSPIGIGIIVVSVIWGIILVFVSQLTLIFIDTENNTRQTMNYTLETMKQIQRTYLMLEEKLCNIPNDLNKLANVENKSEEIFYR